MINISFSNNKVVIDGTDVPLQYEVMDAFELKGKVVVLFDPDSFIPKFGQFKNLIAIDFSGNLLWEAQLPTTESGDCYYKLVSREPLKALSFKSYSCEINVSDGSVTSKDFTK